MSMKEVLYLGVEYVARIHDWIMTLNDSYSAALSDKQLHFLVVGLFGMCLFFVIHPIFKALTRHGHVIVVSWFYVFTLIIVVTFAVEIGQKISNTGTMSFYDIVYGIGGFLWFFAVFAILRGILLLIARLIAKKKRAAEKERSVPAQPASAAPAPEELSDGQHMKGKHLIGE